MGVIKNDEMSRVKAHPAFLAYSRSQVPSISPENTGLKNIKEDELEEKEDQELVVDQKKDQEKRAPGMIV